MSNQTKLIDSVIEAFHKSGLLEKLIFVGSWCIYFYRSAFPEGKILKPVITNDIDINTSLLRKSKTKTSIPDFLNSLGFIINFRSNNSIELMHPELKMEFLVPEVGPPNSDPVKLKGFGITAPPLRFLDILERDVISVDYKGMKIHSRVFSLLS